MEILIAGGAALQARDDGGLQPLHNACSFGHADVVRALLGAGAAPAARDNWGYTPLHEAAAKGKVDVCIGECHCVVASWSGIFFFLMGLLACLIRSCLRVGRCVYR